MKLPVKIAVMIAVIGITGLFASFLINCEGKDYSSRAALWDADTAKVDLCTDQVDNNLDGTMDRYGFPPHCSVGPAEKLTGLGSQVKVVFTGAYSGSTSDVYTIEVSTGTISGNEEISFTSQNGDNGSMMVIPDARMYIGGYGLIAVFSESQGVFNLAQGEKWMVTVRPWNKNCGMAPDYYCYFPDSVSEFACSNEVDDDGDTLIDAEDSSCILDCEEGTTLSRYIDTWGFEAFSPPVPECNDGIDNDGDGYTDLDDPLCGNNTCDLHEDY